MPSWALPSERPDGLAEISDCLHIWTCTLAPLVPQTVFGYVVTTKAGTLVWAEQIPAVTVQNVGDRVKVMPILTL